MVLTSTVFMRYVIFDWYICTHIFVSTERILSTLCCETNFLFQALFNYNNTMGIILLITTLPLCHYVTINTKQFFSIWTTNDINILLRQLYSVEWYLECFPCTRDMWGKEYAGIRRNAHLSRCNYVTFNNYGILEMSKVRRMLRLLRQMLLIVITHKWEDGTLW